MHIRSLPAAALLSSLLSASAFAQSTQTLKVKDSDWPMFSRDLAGTRYSPLTQINTKNVSKLTKAWSYSLRSLAEPGAPAGPPSAASEITPIVVNGVMYLTAGNRVVALEPETGKEIWSYEASRQRPLPSRGVTYWPGDQNNPPRIIFTAGRKMIGPQCQHRQDRSRFRQRRRGRSGRPLSIGADGL